MRFTFLTTLYPSYVAAFYAARPGLSRKSYAEQKKELEYDAFSWNGALEPAFAPLGYIVFSIYANVLPLQRAWARENGVDWRNLSWVKDIASRQLIDFSPDILWIDDLATFRYDWIDHVRQKNNRLRTVLGFTGVEVQDTATIRACDMIFSTTRLFVNRFRASGANAFLFRHAFNPSLLGKIMSGGETRNDLLFVGSVARADGAHLEREKLLSFLVSALPMSLHCPQANLIPLEDFVETYTRRTLYLAMKALCSLGGPESLLRSLPMIGRAVDWRAMPMRRVSPLLHTKMQMPIYGLAMFSELSQHAVTLNTHIDLARDEAGNCRLFEATGVGSCLLTDWKSNLAEMFEPDVEVATFRSAEECLEKARWLLDHPTERDAMAKAGQKRTLRQHTFACRALDLDELLKEVLIN